MTVQGVNSNKDIEIKFVQEQKSESIAAQIKSDFVKSPIEDNFEKKENNELIEKSKKKHLIRNICLGLVSTIIFGYGAIVLGRKLNKPTFKEVQECFKEIFKKDLSIEQTKDLIGKYKEICKNKNTDEFIKKMIEQLKKDYGIENVKTELNIKKLANNKFSTKMNQRERGNASPLAKIIIFPRTSKNKIIRGVQGETFATGFHEMKHIKQYAEAYRANPDKFAEVIYRRNVKPETLEKKVQENIKKAEEEYIKCAKKIKNGDEQTINLQYEQWIKSNPGSHLTKDEYKKALMDKDIDQLIKELKTADGVETAEKLYEFTKKSTEKATIRFYRNSLDERYGKLSQYAVDSEEYKKGMEYIEAYEKYPNPEKDYDAYRANILEKEAWNIADLAKKVYKYTSSIWKL